MMKIIKKLTPLLLLLPVFNLAAMQPMAEDELDATYGQAMFEVLDRMIGDQPGGGELRQVRLTIGARVELNANVEELALGRYWRPEGTNCSGGAGGDKVCYNNIIPAGYNDNINWACTAKPCGSVGLSEDNYHYSDLSHGSNGYDDFFSAPGGYQPDSGIDIKLRDVTMGRIINGQMEPMVQENPYLEFAFDETSAGRKLVGFRVGFEETHGYQGNIIDVISGFIRPTIAVDATLFAFLGVGTIDLESSLGGVRTIGWLDAKTINLVNAGGLTPILIGSPDDLVDSAAHAQLVPMRSNYLNHTKGFFISVGTRSIQWSNIFDFKPELTQPGFWLNLGGDHGLISTTQEHLHPVNYFPGHPLHNQYNVSGANPTNFNNLPTWTETYR